MRINEKLVEIEGQRGTLQIARCLIDNGETLYCHLYDNNPMVKISNNSTAKRALNILQKHELVKKRKSQKRRAIYYKLTKKGERFAKLIMEIEKVLNE
ncbi:MAG: hypothetical protein V5A68_01510 [Candidatus Thermoplasmatota archaeon]